MPSAKVQAANGLLVTDVQDTLGTRIPVADNEPMRGTYTAFVSGDVPATSATDILTITGSATKLIRIRSLIISGTATSASNIQLLFYRRTTANTGGTFTNPTLIRRDANDDAPTATLTLYSANPASLGTTLGVADGARLNVAPAANGSIDRVFLQYGWINDKAPVLRGVLDSFCIGLGGVGPPAGCNLDFNLCISEE